MWGIQTSLYRAHRVGKILLRRSYRRYCCWQWQQRQQKGETRRRFATTSQDTAASSNNTTTSVKPSTSTPQWHQNDHPFMVGKRLQGWGGGGYSLSEIAGNLSFVGVCLAYLHTDILMLRVLSMGSIALSIIFQYYRAIPLWIPIRWNFLLLQINTVMTVHLILERNRADNMSRELENIYKEGLFEARGFSRVEFLRLFEKAKKVKLKRGDHLTKDGRVNTKLYFVTKGKIHIERGSRRLAAVTPNHFIGEMTFLNYLCDTCGDDIMGRTATADAVVVDTDSVAYVWDFDQLKNYLKEEREVRNALSAYMNHDLRVKLARLNVHHATRTKTIIATTTTLPSPPPPP